MVHVLLHRQTFLESFARIHQCIYRQSEISEIRARRRSLEREASEENSGKGSIISSESLRGIWESVGIQDQAQIEGCGTRSKRGGGIEG
jgi:hypothetical protein